MLTIYRRHKQSCPHKSKGRRWTKCPCPVWVQGTLEGRPVKQTLETTNWQRAQQIIHAWETGSYKTQDMSIAEAVTAFNADVETRGIAQPTRKKYKQLFTRLSDFTAQHGLTWLPQFDVAACRDFRTSWGVAPVTANKMLERLRAFFGFCVDSDWLAKNPAKAVKRAKEEQPPTMPFTKEELGRIYRALDDHRQGKTGVRRENAERLRALVLLMRYTAMRISDAVMLRRSQINGGKVLLRQAKTKVDITLPLPVELLDALEMFPHGEYFFGPGPGKHETRSGNWRRGLRKIFAAAELPEGHAHRFRDTLAVEMLEDGAPIEQVAAMLGHDDPRTTLKHYAPWVQTRQKQLEDSVRKLWVKQSTTTNSIRGRLHGSEN